MESKPIALVIGASAPCGQSICKELSKDHVVYGQYCTTKPSVVDANIHWVQARLDSDVDCKKLWDNVLSETEGKMHLLVNVIGPITHTHVDDLDIDEWKSQMHLNLDVVFYMCHYAKKTIEECKGDVVNFSYAGAEHIKRQMDTLPYSIAKTGIVILSKTLAAAMALVGARCNVIAPGFIDSEIVLEKTRDRAKRLVPMGRMATTDEIAAAVRWILDAPRYVTGAVVNVAGGLEFD